jgi:hypothetical protein
VVPRVVLVVVLAWGRLLHAESAADLEARGEAAAKAGDFAGAIDHFKAADKLEVHASHACLIALAYMRRNLWAQAELWRAQCHARASAGDPLPDWIAEADAQFDASLAAANVAEVTIAVTPGDARIAIMGFAPDETFVPRAVHLPPGTYELTASAPGYTTALARSRSTTRPRSTSRSRCSGCRRHPRHPRQRRSRGSSPAPGSRSVRSAAC